MKVSPLPRNSVGLRHAFLPFIRRGRGNSCWTFTGKTTREGYGSISYQSGKFFAHRLAYREFVGPVGCNSVLHKCDNPPCCNPRHLFLGKAVDNMRDMVSKRRHQHADSHFHAKLTSRKARKMREHYAAGVSYKTLMKKYEIDLHTFFSAIHGRTWKYSGGPIARIRKQVGETHARAKLSKFQVKVIRRSRYKVPARILAERYGVNIYTIYHIWCRLSWRKA